MAGTAYDCYSLNYVVINLEHIRNLISCLPKNYNFILLLVWVSVIKVYGKVEHA